MYRLLRDLCRQGLGVVTVTHDLNLALTYADRVLLLNEGRVMADGAPAERAGAGECRSHLRRAGRDPCDPVRPTPGSPMNRRRFWTALAASAGLLAVVSIAAPLIGSTHIDYRRAWAGASPDHEILFYVRLPRVLLAMIAGGTLAVTGVLFQAHPAGTAGGAVYAGHFERIVAGRGAGHLLRMALHLWNTGNVGGRFHRRRGYPGAGAGHRL